MNLYLVTIDAFSRLPRGQRNVPMRPVWAFALVERDFTGSPTRWDFER